MHSLVFCSPFNRITFLDLPVFARIFATTLDSDCWIMALRFERRHVPNCIKKQNTRSDRLCFVFGWLLVGSCLQPTQRLPAGAKFTHHHPNSVAAEKIQVHRAYDTFLHWRTSAFSVGVPRSWRKRSILTVTNMRVWNVLASSKISLYLSYCISFDRIHIFWIFFGFSLLEMRKYRILNTGYIIA